MWTADPNTDYVAQIEFLNPRGAALPPKSADGQTLPLPADPRGDIPRAEWEEFKQLLPKIFRPFPDAWAAFLSAVRAAAMPHLYGPQVT
jgi:hypothetical protein